MNGMTLWICSGVGSEEVCSMSDFLNGVFAGPPPGSPCNLIMACDAAMTRESLSGHEEGGVVYRG
jgi:hypothetical protein